jgi:hypothetical protein
MNSNFFGGSNVGVGSGVGVSSGSFVTVAVVGTDTLPPHPTRNASINIIGTINFSEFSRFIFASLKQNRDEGNG